MHSYLNNLIGHKKNFFHTYAQASYEATYYLQERAGL